jgi:phage protein D
MMKGISTKIDHIKSDPRSIVVVGGYVVPFNNWTVESTGFDTADTFSIKLPFSVTNEPGDLIINNSLEKSSALFTDSDILVEVYRGLPNNPDKYSISDLTQNIMGYVDTVDVDFNDTDGEKVTLTGRNLAALLIDTQITDKYPNKTASQIATLFAKQHGLTPKVTNTTTLAGTFYNQDATTLSSSSSQWDILMFLAQQEGFVVRVVGSSLYFGPISTVTDSTLAPIQMTWGSNIMELTFERSPNAARDLQVQVISYDRHHKHRIVAKAKSTTQYSQRLKNTMQRESYLETYAIPGLTRNQANSIAKSKLKSLSQQQIIGTLKTNGEYNFTIDRRIQLNGCGKVLDGTYYVNRITESFDIVSQNGWDVEIAFINELLTTGASL